MKLPLAIALLAFSGAAYAQTAEFWFSAGESIIENKGVGSSVEVIGSPSDYTIGDGFRFGFRFDLNTGDHIGYELNYAYSRSSLMDNIGGQSSSSGFGIHTVTGDALWHFVKRDSRVRPFVMGGLGFSNFVPPGASAASGGGSNEFLLTYGVGVKVKIGSRWGKDFGIRGDVHQYQYFSKPFGQYFYNASGKLQQTEATVGIGILF